MISPVLVHVRCDGGDPILGDACKQAVVIHDLPWGSDLAVEVARRNPAWVLRGGKQWCGRCAQKELLKP